jgi:Uma2 family endonuclease
MTSFKYPHQQTDPPCSSKKTWLTMYDLPSEDPEESGLPDEFHDLQPQLLSATLRLQDYSSDQIFTGTDLNIYYNQRHPRWHKRPDWFLVVDVPRLYAEQDLRNSYVVWDEGKTPTVVVELLSPGREEEDLGAFVDQWIEVESPVELPPYTIEEDESGIKPPHKLNVYEQILKVPYYVVFDRYHDRLRAFVLTEGRYKELALNEPKLWIPELKAGLGVWFGTFQGIERLWLRWYDAAGNWIPTDTEIVEIAQQRAEQAEAELEALRRRLREAGIELKDET